MVALVYAGLIVQGGMSHKIRLGLKEGNLKTTLVQIPG